MNFKIQTPDPKMETNYTLQTPGIQSERRMTINEIEIPATTTISETTKTTEDEFACVDGSIHDALSIVNEAFGECPQEDGYDVLINTVSPWNMIASAEMIVAYCGEDSYFLKNSWICQVVTDSKPVRYTPRKPDIVRGFYRDPETGLPYWKEIKLRYKS